MNVVKNILIFSGQLCFHAGKVTYPPFVYQFNNYIIQHIYTAPSSIYFKI